MISLDRQIADHITAHHLAVKRHDTRAVHFHRERLRDLRTKQLRRDLGWRGRLRRAWSGAVEWLAPLARIAGTFGMFLLAAAAWTLLMPLDAYASEMAPWQPSAWPLRIIAGIAALSLAAWLVSRMLSARETKDSSEIGRRINDVWTEADEIARRVADRQTRLREKASAALRYPDIDSMGDRK